MPSSRDIDRHCVLEREPHIDFDDDARQLIDEDAEPAIPLTKTTIEPSLRRRKVEEKSSWFGQVRSPLVGGVAFTVLCLCVVYSFSDSSNEDVRRTPEQRDLVNYYITEEQSVSGFSTFLKTISSLQNESALLMTQLDNLQTGFKVCGEIVCGDDSQCCEASKLCCARFDQCCGKVCCAAGTVCCPHLAEGMCFAAGTVCDDKGIKIVPLRGIKALAN